MAIPYMIRPARPFGILMLTILQIVSGIGDILLGIVLILAYAVASALVGGGLLATAFLLLGIVAFGLGIFSFVLAYGIWIGKGLVWGLSMIGALIGLALGLFGLASSASAGLTLESLTNLIPIILSAIVIVYLNTGPVRAFFGRSVSIATVRPVVQMTGGPPYLPLTETQPSVEHPYYPQPQQAAFPQPTVQQPYPPQSTSWEIRFCRSCGTPAQPGANFCDRCGAHLR